MKMTRAFAGVACVLGWVGTAAAQWGTPAAYGVTPPTANVSPGQYTPGAYVPSASYPQAQAGGMTAANYYPTMQAAAYQPSPTPAPPRDTVAPAPGMQYNLPTPSSTPFYGAQPPAGSAPSYVPYTPTPGSSPAYGTPPYTPTPGTAAPYAAPTYGNTPSYGEPSAGAPTYSAPTYGANPYAGPMTPPIPRPDYSPNPYGAGPGPNSMVAPTGPAAGPLGPGAAPYSPSPYTSPYTNAFDGADGCDTCGMDTCGMDGCCAGGKQGAWFASLAGLLMTRDRPNGFVTTGLTTNPNLVVLDTNDARINWVGGYEARVGRAFGEQFAVEGTYWALARSEGQFTQWSPTNSLQSTLTFGGLTAGGTPLATLFNNSPQHQVTRNDEIHNLEINVLEQVIPAGCTRFGMTGIAGARWFRFDEGVNFASAASGTAIGDNVNTGNYDVDTLNNLIGGQIGARTHYYLGKVRLYAIPKVGVYANSIKNRAQIYRGDGASAFNFTNYKTDVSMIGQLDVGASWQVLQRVSLFMAYRGMGVTGLSLSDDNYVNDVSNLDAVQAINSNGSLILHGMVAGAQWSF